MNTRTSTAAQPAAPSSSSKAKPHGDDEPEITQEESVPSDGKDEEGEKMMEDLGREIQKRRER